MGLYDKHIEYLDLWEFGEKVGNVGFAKIEVREQECRIWISVKGLYPTDMVVGQLFLLSAEEEILADQFLVHSGMGTYAAKWETQNLAQMGLTYEAWNGIRIKISEQRRIEKHWNRGRQIPLMESERKEAEEKVVDRKIEENAKNSEAIYEKESHEKERYEKKEEVKEGQLQMNKWGRLGQYYKKKKPFGDEREYLCISPEDLILLPEKYEHLYKNSFLLHGYYAYGHLLLGAERIEEQTTYQLCIPGMGHDKERLVASMFGFKNFVPAMKIQEDKSSEEGQGISLHKFGYYQMMVEI